MGWNYREKAPNEKVRDPIQGEFFSTEAIRNPADALVREAIQNSLDATLKNGIGEPQTALRVRFFLATGPHALPATSAGRWFDGAWDHMAAPGNGLRDAPHMTEGCPWLVIEDFGTCGLEGDIRQAEPIDGQQNHFFCFFRAEGKSVEGGKERGRWGVGKHVFPRSSRANSFFALTIRNGDRQRLLLGASVLKWHWLGAKYYSPDGYFGTQDERGLALPLHDSVVLEVFRNQFRLERTTEPGLSVVVPWIDPEITAQTLIDGVVRGYFYPILKGALSVTVATPDQVVTIDKSSLEEVALALDLEGAAANDFLSLIDLAQWASTRTADEVLALRPCSAERPQWKEDLIPADQMKPLQAALANGDKVAVRAFVTVREKGKEPVQSDFTLYIWKDGYESGRPVFIRDGLNISDVKAPRTRGYRSLVVIEAGPLGRLLGDAENPAHTEWQSKGENFRGKYTYGPSFLDFVRDAVSRFVGVLTSRNEEVDRSLLLDIFSLPPAQPEEEPKTPKPKKEPKGKQPDDPPDPQEPRKKRFRVTRAEGGFTVSRGDAGTQPPAQLHIKCAYDTRRKRDAFPLYEKSLKAKSPDFRIGKDGVQIARLEGVEIIEAKNNQLRVAIQKEEFHLTVSGFDRNRDLVVDVKMEETTHDS